MSVTVNMNLKIVVILFLWFSQIIATPITLKKQAINCGVLSCPILDPTKINVHLIPHSHDDVGWLKTVDQYYYGMYKDIQDAGVQYIITSYVEALKQDPKRRFIQVETAFFWMWWKDQNDAMKQDFIDLVNNGQIEIINGAWSMNDEASTNYQSTIDQFTWGFRILDEALGSCGHPKIGWQIDPFGHSREHASILKQLGFDGLVIGRIDYRDKEKRKADRNLDFLWQSSANLNESTIFTTMFPDFYGTIENFCWDQLCSDDPINNEPSSPDYNLPAFVTAFSNIMDSYSTYYKTRNIMVPFGGDFYYQGAELNFMNIDKLIKGFENHETYNIFYSTPSCYIKAVKDDVMNNSIELSVKTDDFFPYAMYEHSFLTGFFTSRPTLKRLERMANNILQGMKQLTSFAKMNGKNYDLFLYSLREALGIIQHHDAITGTEKQAVAKDYARIVTKAIRKGEEALGVIVGDLLKKGTTDVVNLELSTCLLANVSICEPTTNTTSFVIVVYNPLARYVSHYIRTPVQDGTYKITGPDGEEINEVVNSIHDFNYIPEVTIQPKELIFYARDLPPMGLKMYYVEMNMTIPSNIVHSDNEGGNSDLKIDDLTFGNEVNGFVLDPVTKLLKTVTIRGQSLNVTQELLYYTSWAGDNSMETLRSSGAYIFRPVNTTVKPLGEIIEIESYKGILFDEVKQIINNDTRQIIRVYKSENESYIEFDWLVGNLPINPTTMQGSEIVMRFTITNFTNGNIFYTDSNGREQIKRQLNHRNDYEYDPSEEPISSNYYPVTSKIVIKDETKNLQFAVLNDRSQGGSCIQDGVMELMLHRRLLQDDRLGVNEALNEFEFSKGVYVRGQHYLTFGPINSGTEMDSSNVLERDLALKKRLAPWVLLDKPVITLAQLQQNMNFQFEGLTRPLMKNINLLTLEPWTNDSYLLRLEHILEKGEDSIFSKPVVVDITDLFTNYVVSEIQETNLGANEILENYKIWNQQKASFVITLDPMQIRTFIVKFVAKKTDNDNGGTIIITGSLSYIFVSIFFVRVYNIFVW